MVADKPTLEDYVNFCGIEFEVVEGLYWNSGGVHEVKDTVVSLNRLRDEYKAAGIPIQEVIKLIVNSSYGKLMLKKTNESYVVKLICDYISERFGLFKHMTEFGHHTEICMAKYDDAYTRNHLMSK